jgi:pimeloyl-ACP methyl ester carboxylesterase
LTIPEAVVAHDGVTIALRHHLGETPGLLLAHATGFCKECWEPVTATGDLSGRAWISFDQRAHGGSGVPALPFDWWDGGRDVLAMVDRSGWERCVGVGHSSGGAALALAEILRPGTFAALVLIEPILLPGPARRRDDEPLAAQAERRRSVFPSPEAARAAFHRRGPFARWVDEALDAYVRGGLRREGDVWLLRCAPEHEAEHYRVAWAAGAWERLAEVRCPVIVAGGSNSASHPQAFLEELASRFPRSRLEILDGATHFAPMEVPGDVAALVVEASAGLETGGR